MTKALRCSSCGAALTHSSGQPNTVCGYCNSFVRVSDDKSEQFDTAVILNQIISLWPRVRKDDFTDEYQSIKDLLSGHKFVAANKRLNAILQKDSTQSRAWFYKSLLPILEQETVSFKGCFVNVYKVSQITDRARLRVYLKNCGLGKWQQREFLSFYRSTNFLYQQQIKFLDKAIEHASTEDRIAFFTKHKTEVVKRHEQKLRRRNFVTWALILTLFGVIAGAIVLAWFVSQGAFSWI